MKQTRLRFYFSPDIWLVEREGESSGRRLSSDCMGIWKEDDEDYWGQIKAEARSFLLIFTLLSCLHFNRIETVKDVPTHWYFWSIRTYQVDICETVVFPKQSNALSFFCHYVYCV